MDNFSEQKSQYKPYSDYVVSHARPKAIIKPNNLFLTGDIELFPEYTRSYVPYSLDSIYKCNKPPCYHIKPKREKIVKKAPSQDYIPPSEEPVRMPREDPRPPREEAPQALPERDRAMEAKLLNNNYGVACTNRYHEKLDSENNNYMPEYRSKYQPFVAQRSDLIPQISRLGKNDGDGQFHGASEYTNRYKTYDHFTKSAPIKKQDNLHMTGMTQMRPEYKDRYKEIDMHTYVRRQPYRQHDNLQSEGDFGHEMPEYHEKYKDHHISSFPERAKPKHDFLCLNGEMEYSPEYRGNYVEFPRQRPFVKRPPTNVRMPTSHEIDRKPDNVGLPINLSYHESGSTRLMRTRSQEEEDEPITARPEYRKAMRHYMIKERSPSRASDVENQPKKEKLPPTEVANPNDVSKILTENKVNLPQEKIFDENNEVIVEPIRGPPDFKIPTRSPIRHAAGKCPSYPLQKDHRFNEQSSMAATKRNSGRRGNVRVTIEDYDHRHRPRESYSFESDQEPQEVASHYQPRQQRKSPKFGRRAPNLTEDYHLRTKTNVVEANPRYVREKQRSDIHPNRHEQRGYYHQSNPHPIPMAQPPTESLANNYRPNYEIDKQHNYRESLRDDKTPFVVIEQQQRGRPNSWMKKQWYDTQ